MMRRTARLQATTLAQKCALPSHVVHGMKPGFDELAAGYAKKGNVSSVKQTIKTMQQKGSQPDVETYNHLVYAQVEAGAFHDAWNTMEGMKSKGIQPNAQTFEHLLRRTAATCEFEQATSILKTMRNVVAQPDISSYEALVEGFCSTGQTSDGYKLVQMMAGHVNPSVNIFNFLAQAHLTRGEADKALSVMTALEAGGLQANATSVNLMVRAYIAEGHLTRAAEMVMQMRPHNMEPEPQVVAALCDAMQKSGMEEIPDLTKMNAELQAAMVAEAPQEPIAAAPVTEATAQEPPKKKKTSVSPEVFELATSVYEQAKREGKVNYAVSTLYRRLCTLAGDHARAKEVDEMRKDMKLTAPDITAYALQQGAVVGPVWTPGDTLRPDGHQEMIDRVTSAGYAPKLWMYPEHMPDAVRKAKLHHHAEKKALAWVLKNTPSATPTAITKRGSQCCNDCKEFFEIAAKVYKRELTLHDLQGHAGTWTPDGPAARA